MSFYGKKFRRTHYENIDKLMLKSNQHQEKMLEHFLQPPPIVCITKVDDEINVDLQTENKHFSDTFKLGEEKVIERLDGKKIKMTYIQEGDNILKQIIVLPDGKKAFFKREFNGSEGKLTVTIEGHDQAAQIYFKEIE